MKKERTEKIVIIVLIIIIVGLLVWGLWPKKQLIQETEKIEIVRDQEAEASQKLEKDIWELTDGDNSGNNSNRSSEIGSVFNYQGQPDLSFVKYDFGIYLTPVTVGSNEYVPIKFLKKSYISKLAPQISGLEANSVPKTDKPNPDNRPAGKDWNLDKSGTAYYFVDFGQKVKATGNSADIIVIPLNAYAGEKPGGYEIWLMYEAAVLNKQGFNQSWTFGDFISNGDGGYDYGAKFKGYKNLKN